MFLCVSKFIYILYRLKIFFLEAQFFINVNNNDFLNHTSKSVNGWGYCAFGKVTEGQEVVDQIAQDDIMESVTIVRVGEEAEAFNAIEAFRVFEGERTKRIEETKKQQQEELDKIAAGFDETVSGLRYKILENGEGKV